VRLSGGGRAVELWVDGSWPYLMVFTGDTLEPDRRRRALAVEPMTCPPGALATGQDLVRLEPGQEWEGRFGIEAVAP
jgi:aldose 1-epimerase